ncbi:MAG: hypothetical protein KDD32_07710 [Bacteroidetes bacterium]|nr:hypothetical protein [Bacteroidota bacterium]
MIQEALTILALIFAIYLLVDTFILPSKNKRDQQKACGINGTKKCGCD